MVSDGASVLSDKRAGVQATLTKEVNPHLTYIWCISHRLQLATKDAPETWMLPIQVTS